ncbi:DNA adenine methylase [Parafrankia sp. FMc6]|uniref:DNA adenine methylase n=1 Tax=Parafrankia soli TaxID=2599596 RepID=UPI0034D53EA2
MPIRWAVTTTGKRMPIDADPAPDGNITVHRDGGQAVATVHANGEPLEGPRWTSHFATCAQAAQHRKPAPEPPPAATGLEAPAPDDPDDPADRRPAWAPCVGCGHTVLNPAVGQPAARLPGPATRRHHPHPTGDAVTRPPFAYFGGKTLLADRIVALLPKHEHYVEPFAGSLAVLLAKPRSAMETVNDLDQNLMTFWRVLREQPADLMRACALTPHSRAEFELAFDGSREPAADDLERARRVWAQLSQARTGTLRRTGWRHYVNPAGSDTSMPGYLAGYVDRMASAAERLAAVSLECRPGLDLCERYGREPDVLMYVDPPYLGSVRSRNYAVEMGSEAEHRALADVLRSTRSAVVLSGYDSDLYRDLYADWDRVSIETQTGQGTRRSARTEVLWFNRPLIADLFSETA